MRPSIDPNERRTQGASSGREGFPDGVTSAPLHPELVEVREARRRSTERQAARLLSRRAVAGVLDVAAAVGTAALVTAAAASLLDLPPEQRPLVAIAVALLVDAGLPMRPGRRRGQTAGKQIVGLRTRRVDGEPLHAGRMLQLSWLRWMSQIFRRWTYTSYDRSTDTEVVDARNPPPVRPLRGATPAPFDHPPATRTTPFDDPSATRATPFDDPLATRTTSSREDR